MDTHITFNGRSGTIWRIVDVEFDRVTEDEPVRGLPKNAADLQWYLAINEPCLAGDDIYFAIDGTTIYSTFDGYCTKFHHTTPDDLESVAKRVVTIDGDELEDTNE